MTTRFACLLVCLVVSLAGCKRQPAAPEEIDLLGTAVAEATQIIQAAQATALVLNAQRQATSLMAGPTGQPVSQAATSTAALVLPVAPPEGGNTMTTEAGANSTPTPEASTVELLGVGIGAEGNFIEVYFLAPPQVAGTWYQGNVSVVDENTGTVYNEVPVIPVVGPLFGKPVEAGQMGYVMFVNAPTPLQSGAIVTVTLGEYVFEHVQVK